MNNSNAPAFLRPPQILNGVLSDDELLLGGMAGGKRVLQTRLLPREAHELMGLLEYLWQQDVTTVWVLPMARLSQQVTCHWLKQVNNQWIALVRPAQTGGERPASALFWPRGHERRLTLVFPEHAGWHWRLPDAVSLLATVTYLEQVLARQVIEPPEHFSYELLTELTRGEPISQLRASPVDLWNLPDREGAPIPLLEGAEELAWKRSLTLEEERQRYLHKYRAASRALRSCLDVALGTGTPQHSPNGRAFDGSRPGIWRVQLERAGSLFDGKMLPGCLQQHWFSTPQVVCCRKIGYEVQVQEGYAWTQSHQAFKPWATSLWQALERLQSQPQHFRHAQARANVMRSINQLVEQTMGLLYKPQAEGGWNRPDWWAQIRGRQQALLFADLVQLVRRGTMPVLIHGDDFWVVSRDPNPRTAAPGLFSRQRWLGFVPAYDVPLFLSKDVYDLLRGKAPVDQVVSELDHLAEEELS